MGQQPVGLEGPQEKERSLYQLASALKGLHSKWVLLRKSQSLTRAFKELLSQRQEESCQPLGRG